MSLFAFEGTVVPSSLVSDGPTRPTSGFWSSLRFPVLYPGRITKVVWPDEEENSNKKYAEYQVVIQQESPDNALRTSMTIYRCRVASIFGGVADYETWTPRLATKDPMTVSDRATKEQLEIGSQVLVLCLNGNSQSGIIIGGLPHTEGTVVDSKYKGHHWERRFNGLTMKVDEEGQFTLAFEGATNADGSLADSADPAANGSQMTFTRDGAIKLETKDGQQSLHLDHAKNKITVRANSELEITGLDPDGETPKFHLTMTEGGLTVKLKNGATLAVVGKDGDTQMTVGDGAKHVAIVEELQALYTELKTKLDIFDFHIHATGVGPSGPPTPTIGAPSWNSAINSTKVSIPGG